MLQPVLEPRDCRPISRSMCTATTDNCWLLDMQVLSERKVHSWPKPDQDSRLLRGTMVRASKIDKPDLLRIQDALRAEHEARSGIADAQECSEQNIKMYMRQYASEMLYCASQQHRLHRHFVQPSQLAGRFGPEMGLPCQGPVAQGRGKGGRPTWQMVGQAMLWKRGPDRFALSYGVSLLLLAAARLC